MKKVVLALLLMVGLTVSAQDKPAEGKTCAKGEKSCKSPEQCVEKMTKALDLNADQQAKIKEIVAQKQAKVKASHDEADAKIKTVLTAEQYTKWEGIKKEECSKDKKCCSKGKKSCSKDKKEEKKK